MYAALAVVLLLLTVPGPGQDAGAVLKRVDTHYNRLKTLRARFVERYNGMGMRREETGTLLLAKPGRMRWDYDRPTGKVFLVDEKFAWSYTPGDGQAQRIATKKIDDLRSPLRFLLGHTALGKELEGVLVVPEQGGGFRISGVLRGIGHRTVMHVDANGGIRSVAVDETGGGTTSFSFSEVRENEGIPAGEFVFTIPSGVGVVEGLPPV